MKEDSKRMIHAQFFRSGLVELPWYTRMLFLGLLLEADEQGRFVVNERQFYREFFFDDGMTTAMIREGLGQLNQNESIRLYTVEGVEYGQILNWWKYQSLQWAPPSEYPPPDGWVDKVRYHPKGVDSTVLTHNWERNNGDKLPDTCDQMGRPLMELPPPKRESPPDEPAAGPENHHQGEHRTHANDSTPPIFGQEVVGGGVATPPPTTVGVGVGGRQERKEKKEDIISTRVSEGGEVSTGNDLDRVHTAHGTPKASPPLWMPTSADRQWLSRPEQHYLDGLRRQVAGLGLDMAAFRSLVDHILDKHGKLAIARLETADGVQALKKAQECVLALLVTDRVAYASRDGIDAVYASWAANDWRAPSLPNLSQLVEHAGLMTKGLVVNEANRQSTATNGADAGRVVTAYRVRAGNQSGLGEQYTDDEIEQIRARSRKKVQYFQ